ncbi:MAG: RnfABCDGE type electron transport complex subunit G [Fibrobacterales bacterium]
MAKKLDSTFLNMVVVLTAIAVISALALAITNEKTKDLIKEVQKKKTLAAISTVVPGLNNDPSAEQYTVEGFEGLTFYPGKKDGTLIGTAVETFADGFTEAVWIMVGFDSDNKIITTSVLRHKETPGLGTKMAEPKFKDQFDGKDPLEYTLRVTKDGGAVDAIAAATISSRAFSAAVQKAYDAMLKKGTLIEEPATQPEAVPITPPTTDSTQEVTQ